MKAVYELFDKPLYTNKSRHVADKTQFATVKSEFTTVKSAFTAANEKWEANYFLIFLLKMAKYFMFIVSI